MHTDTHPVLAAAASLLLSLCLCLSLCLALVACSSRDSTPAEATTHGATAIGTAECAACGMVVREQPAPRGQLVHRDGTRRHFCSIDDMRQYTRAPSPHGKVTEVYLETLAPGADPAEHATHEHAWVPASQAHLVRGAPRKGIMGEPVLVYETAAEARDAAARVGGEPTTWEAFQSATRAFSGGK